jgi:hypothetical protein
MHPTWCKSLELPRRLPGRQLEEVDMVDIEMWYRSILSGNAQYDDGQFQLFLSALLRRFQGSYVISPEISAEPDWYRLWFITKDLIERPVILGEKRSQLGQPFSRAAVLELLLKSAPHDRQNEVETFCSQQKKGLKR